jgi:hypothetical protein
MQTLVVDTGMLIRLANATTLSGGNLLNTLIQLSVQLIIPDAVRKEATYNTSFADAAAWVAPDQLPAVRGLVDGQRAKLG